MEEIVTCIATKLAECLWDQISQGARYLFRFKQFIGDLEKAKKELEVELEDLNERKDEAVRETKEIMPSVKKWLEDVDSILEEVQKLQQELEEGGKKCSNVYLRYSLAKRMEDKVKRMMELKQNSNFVPFSRLTQLPGITYLSSKEFVDFNSRKSTYNHLLEAIKDGNKKMVGLYGMAGSGKTTLAKEVGKKMEELKLFNKVVMTVISKTPNVFSIQQEIAEQIGLKFEETTQFTRAQRLSLGLKNKRVLIILDDMWCEQRLEDIGIPLSEGCCVLLTTRLREVCVSMDCENIIELGLLTDEEAWDLFKMRANITNVSMNEFDNIGRKIVDECKGLPIAIVTVGIALKGKGIVEWESALRRLQHSLPLDIDESSRGPYACLEFSYDKLPSPLAQSLFLLCSMFPEDHEIHIEDLIRFCKGALKFDEISYTMEGARSEILASTNRLLDSCLLMRTDKEACLKMHDLVRDVALWIAKKQHRAILVDSQAVSRMMVENESLEKTEVISLWNLEDNFKLSNQLRCPTLELLLLHPQGFIEDIGGIEALRVLALVTFSFQWRSYWYAQIQWSPQSTVSSLINLHTICFRGIELGDISFLCQLKRLEILDLRHSKFNELPDGIVHLKRLKLLDVFGCEIEKSPLGVIEKCEQLEELYFCDQKSAIQENFSLSRLKRYVIYDSTCSFNIKEEAPFLEYFDGCIEALRALSIQGFKVSALNSSMKDLIFRANYLWLENCLWDCKDISFEIKRLVVSHCPKRRFVVDASLLQTGQVLSHLITLRLRQMDSLEQVFSHATLSCHCPSLKELKIEDCPKLDRLVDEEATQGDPLLDDTKDNPHGTVSAFVVVKADSFDHMRNQKLLTLLLSLEVVRIQRSGRRMKGMFEVQVMRRTLLEREESVGEQEEPLKLLNSELRMLELEELPVLEYIWKGPAQSVSLHRLEDITLSGCPKLRNIFTPAVVTSLPELRRLYVFDCEEWEGVFCEESLKNLSPSNVCFPKLQRIWIRGCNKVKRLFPYSHCPSLEELSISECFELERVFDEAAANRDGLPLLKLESSTLSNLPKLRDIFGEGVECPQQKNKNERGRMVNTELRRIFLQELPVLECIWKGPTQSLSLHRLEEVALSGCPKLRNIFTPAVVTSLPELRSLKVNVCEELEGVFCEESLKNLSPSNVCFPELLQIDIRGCNKVKRLFPYSLASHCPSLEELSISECFELERVFDEAAANRDGLPLLKLKSLTLYNLPKLRDIFGEGLECPQQKNQNERGSLVNSELCRISLGELPALECIWKGPTQSLSLHRLEVVQLSGCPKLRNIFTPAVVTTSLPELWSLLVWGCEEWEGVFCEESLKNLSPSNVCFPELLQIDIRGCNKVKRLFPYSLASHCPSLEEISIEDCFELERLFDEAAANRDGLPLLKLNSLTLSNLPKLRDIFVEGMECPQQKNKNERGRVVNSELFHILLQELPVLECIWMGPRQSVSLHGLDYVELRRCPKVKNIFTLAIVPSLPELTKLDVSGCKEWEGIFCEESLVNLSSSSSSSFNVCFPELMDIHIDGCNKVKWLFPYSLASHCPSLQTIEIKDCCEIEGVFEGCEGEAGNQEKPFPRLRYLSLKNLPKLRDIYKGHEFNLVSGPIGIRGCPSIQNIPLLAYMASSDSEIESENEVDEDDSIPSDW